MKISALWITKNEEANIKKSIKSVANIADEIIVVDTGSTDNTISVAENAGARIENFEWINDFSAAKNFALSKASGDIIIFLDADEWFEPKLKQPDKNEIIKILSNTKVDIIECSMQNIETSGAVKAINNVMRIFKKGLVYTGKIHESLAWQDGRDNKASKHQNFIIKHTGYAEDTIKSKTERNLELFRQIEADGEELSISDKFYLMRENNMLERYDEAYIYFEELLRSKKKVSKFVTEFSGGPLYFYIALKIAAKVRGKVSRKEVYSGTVELMKKALPNYPGSDTIELFYMLGFEKNDRKLLEKLKEYEKTQETAKNVKEAADDNNKSALVNIYEAAALAELRSGNKEIAMNYAVKSASYKGPAQKNDYTEIFVKAIKGADEASTVILLDKINTLMGGDVSDVFLDRLMYERLKNVYLYFFKKQYESGKATKARFLYLKILNGSPQEAVEAALENRGEMTEKNLSELIFCAVICADSEEFFEANQEHLGEYLDAAEAYFSGNALRLPNRRNIEIYNIQYWNIVFAAGKETGEKFLSVFSNYPLLRLKIKSNYYLSGAMYEEFLEEEAQGAAEFTDASAKEIFAKCYIGAGNYHGALGILESLIKPGEPLGYDILNLIGAVANNADGEIKQRAEAVYGIYYAILEESIDLLDVINTGIIIDDTTKKDLRKLANLSIQEFNKEVSTTHVALPEIMCGLYEKAAKTYMEKGAYAPAEKYLKRLVAAGHNKQNAYEKLAEVYEKLGNKSLKEALL